MNGARLIDWPPSRQVVDNGAAGYEQPALGVISANLVIMMPLIVTLCRHPNSGSLRCQQRRAESS